MFIDVFNGDADGICALVQLRLADPRSAQLVTGVKRDIALLDKVLASSYDDVTVLDISMAKNRLSLMKILASGAKVFYVDHHQSGEIPQHDNLQTIIDTNANTCTSLLINEYLKGKYLPWAVTAACGDNLTSVAINAARSFKFSEQQLNQLQTLGICLNYNSYGNTINDLHIHPEQLYQTLVCFSSPLDFIQENTVMYDRLKDGYAADMANAEKMTADYNSQYVSVFILPDERWARRVNGVFGNHLANKTPEKAHAVITHNNQQGYQVSVRAPLACKIGADELCASFPTGGGRKAAAGINHLPYSELRRFIVAFDNKYNSAHY